MKPVALLLEETVLHLRYDLHDDASDLHDFRNSTDRLGNTRELVIQLDRQISSGLSLAVRAEDFAGFGPPPA